MEVSGIEVLAKLPLSVNAPAFVSRALLRCSHAADIDAVVIEPQDLTGWLEPVFLRSAETKLPRMMVTRIVFPQASLSWVCKSGTQWF